MNAFHTLTIVKAVVTVPNECWSVLSVLSMTAESDAKFKESVGEVAA